MRRCFVIQPFDRGAFDKRYEDVIEPAIKAADLEAYRVDEDPHASIPIEQIESGIRTAAVCIADITTDNPNVWFELGFAISTGRPVVLVSAASRQRFPFDVQHRNVITYDTDSSSDFDALRNRITKRLTAVLSKEAQLGRAAQVESPVALVHSLAPHERETLVAVAENLESPNDWVSTYAIRNNVKRGVSRMSVTLALASLVEKSFLMERDAYDGAHQERYTAYSLTPNGFRWLQANHEPLDLANPSEDEDVPF